MKLRNLLHIRENDVHIIGTLMPPFFCRVSDVMEDFIQLCDNNTVENSFNLLKEKYSTSEISDFQRRLDKIKDKVLANDDYNDAYKIDLSSKVYILTLNVTRKCNLKCDYCFEDSEYRKLGNMTFDIAKKAIDTFFTSQTNTPDWVIIFTGGEPMLNFDLIKNVVEYINYKGLNVKYKIKTNATLLDDEKMDFLINNNFKIQISLDGNEKAHDTHRKFANGKGTFRIVDKNIHKLIRKNCGQQISISGTVTHQTIQYIDNCYTHLNTYKEIKGYSLKSVMPNSHSQYAFNLDDYKIGYLSNIANNKYLIWRKQLLSETKKSIDLCGIGIWNITIDIDGTIYPCYRMCGNEKYVMGDLNSLEFPLKLSQDIISLYKIENLNKCSKCGLINICKAGCYADKLSYTFKDNECFHQVNTIFYDILYNDLVTTGMYRFLDIV
jgi:uncharacterized protein